MGERNPRGDDWVEDARAEIKGMAKDGMGHPSTKPVLAGAAIGGVAGFLLPVVSIPFGIIAGMGFAFYQRIKR